VISEYPRFDQDRVSISERCWSVREIMCRSQNSVGLFVGIGLDGVDSSKTRIGFHFKVKFWIFIYLNLF